MHVRVRVRVYCASPVLQVMFWIVRCGLFVGTLVLFTIGSTFVSRLAHRWGRVLVVVSCNVLTGTLGYHLGQRVFGAPSALRWWLAIALVVSILAAHNPFPRPPPSSAASDESTQRKKNI